MGYQHREPDNTTSTNERKALTSTQIGTKNYQDISIGASAVSIDSNNSSTDTLADAATYTGTGTDISKYATITVFVDTDIDGTLKMQFSSDNSNWDRQKTVVVDQDIGSGSVHTLEVVAQYFRVVYVNSTGNGAQGHFRLQTILHQFRSGFLTSSPDEIISKTNDAQIVRIANDPWLDISRGLYADKYSFSRFAHNNAVPNGSFGDIWAYGPVDASYNWPTASEKFRVQAGGNAADDASGLGARTIQIVFLDANGNQVQEQLTLAGASASASTSVTGRRVIRAWVDTCGTILSNNTGRIIIENETTNQIVATIEAGEGQTRMSMYTVPLGYTAYLIRIDINVAIGTNKDADIIFWQRQDAYTVAAPFGVKRIIKEWDAVQGNLLPTEFRALPTFPALTDLYFEAQGNGAATEVDIQYDLILVKDEVPTAPQ